MTTHESSETPNVWVIEGDDHEVRLIEAVTAQEAIEIAVSDFADQYEEPYDEDLCSVAGAFVGDSLDPEALVFVSTAGAEDESYAREALDRC